MIQLSAQRLRQNQRHLLRFGFTGPWGKASRAGRGGGRSSMVIREKRNLKNKLSSKTNECMNNWKMSLWMMRVWTFSWEFEHQFICNFWLFVVFFPNLMMFPWLVRSILWYVVCLFALCETGYSLLYWATFNFPVTGFPNTGTVYISGHGDIGDQSVTGVFAEFAEWFCLKAGHQYLRMLNSLKSLGVSRSAQMSSSVRTTEKGRSSKKSDTDHRAQMNIPGVVFIATLWRPRLQTNLLQTNFHTGSCFRPRAHGPKLRKLATLESPPSWNMFCNTVFVRLYGFLSYFPRIWFWFACSLTVGWICVGHVCFDQPKEV